MSNFDTVSSEDVKRPDRVGINLLHLLIALADTRVEAPALYERIMTAFAGVAASVPGNEALLTDPRVNRDPQLLNVLCAAAKETHVRLGVADGETFFPDMSVEIDEEGRLSLVETDTDKRPTLLLPLALGPEDRSVLHRRDRYRPKIGLQFDGDDVYLLADFGSGYERDMFRTYDSWLSIYLYLYDRTGCRRCCLKDLRAYKTKEGFLRMKLSDVSMLELTAAYFQDEMIVLDGRCFPPLSMMSDTERVEGWCAVPIPIALNIRGRRTKESTKTLSRLSKLSLTIPLDVAVELFRRYAWVEWIWPGQESREFDLRAILRHLALEREEAEKTAK